MDTNVWLDYCLAERAGHRDAMRLVDVALAGDIGLLVCATSLKDVFYIVARSLKLRVNAETGVVSPQDAAAINRITWALIDNICSVAAPASVGPGDVWMAQRHEDVHGDFEDDLIIATALRTKADLLVTNDKALIVDCPVAAVTVQRALALLGS